MAASTPAPSSRERILDAAVRVMRERGLANTTTKLIAAQAGLSEAMLYKHFADKQQLFLSVLRERTPRARFEADAGGESLAAGLAALVADLMTFFTRTFRSPPRSSAHRHCSPSTVRASPRTAAALRP